MSNSKTLTCFKAYDVRGKLGEELNEEIAYRIGRATAQSLNANTIVLGFDARATSPNLARSLARGICHAGADVLNIGLTGTEEMYAAVSEFGACAGIEVTASHNPINYNGMKIVKHCSQPLTDQEFSNIKQLAEQNNPILSNHSGLVIDKRSAARNTYIEKIIDLVDLQSLQPLKIVINSGNGAAGPTIDVLKQKMEEKGIITNFVYVHHDPDPSFPNGIPNPMLAENRSATADVVISEEADFGVAFDGDFDRCFLFDQGGNFIPGEYVLGLLTKVFLRKERGATIVHDPRVIWNTIDVVSKCGGRAVSSKTGHSFVKAAMRENGAIYGGEISAHHYFRDFAYCDSGMIPWLMIWELISKSNLFLSDLILERKQRFPSSGEINFTVADPENCLEMVNSLFASGATSIDELDGLSMCFENWRFNLRKSNTEPLVRLNIETRGDQFLLREKTKIFKKIMKNA